MLFIWIVLTILVAIITGSVALFSGNQKMVPAMLLTGVVVDAGLYFMFFGFNCAF